MVKRILLVEDNLDLAAQVQAQLRGDGYDVTHESHGDAAMGFNPRDFDLVILDLMLPGTYGLDILKRFRRECDTPVIILSAKTETGDKVRGLQLGADDYVTKPFWPEELSARIQTRLRRPVLERDGVISIGELSLSVDKKQVKVQGEGVQLTEAEFSFLATLAKRPNQAVTRESLIERVLDPEKDGLNRTLDSHASRLRKKLGACGEMIQTVWGIGYRICAE